MQLQPNDIKTDTMLLVNKPLGWTSFDVVKKLRNVLKVRKIGHAGTLDPLATGLLIICTGNHTKTISQYQALGKVYTGRLVLGKTTPSIDLETDFDSERPYHHLKEADIIQATRTFIGTIDQVPPTYSAVKIDGVRAYKSVRKGATPILQPRTVTISEFSITSVDLPDVTFKVVCSKGTYIRSLVRDLGEKLGTGAYLAQLCRTQIGPYRLQDAYDIATLTQMVNTNLSS